MTAPSEYVSTVPEFNYRAFVIKWVDGDTVDLTIDLGFHVFTKVRCRLLGVDTPERGKPGYAEACQFVRNMAPPDSPAFIWSEKPADKYGRFLVWLYPVDHAGNAGFSVNVQLLDAKLAKRYDGGTRT